MRLDNVTDFIVSSERRGVIEDYALDEIKLHKSKNRPICDAGQGSFLRGYGIQSSPIFGTVHPHPVSKHLELHLYDVVRHHLQGRPVTAISLKEEKYHLLGSESVTGVNLVLEPKDTGRYKNGHTPEMVEIHTEDAISADVGHHRCLSEFVEDFERSPCLQRMYVTMVYPEELMVGCREMYPKAYSFRLRSGGLDYFPDGHVTGGYRQGHGGAEILQTGEIQRGATVVTITRLESVASHHLMLISRTQVDSRETRYFGSAEHILVPTVASWFGGLSIAVPKKFHEGFSQAVLRAGSYTWPQLFGRAQAINLTLESPIPKDDLVLAVDYAVASNVGFRAGVEYFYQRDRFWHVVTRCLVLATLRMLLLHPGKAARLFSYSVLDTKEAVRAIECDRVVLPVDCQRGMSWSRERSRPTVREMSSHILAVLHPQLGWEYCGTVSYPDFILWMLCIRLIIPRLGDLAFSWMAYFPTIHWLDALSFGPIWGIFWFVVIYELRYYGWWFVRHSGYELRTTIDQVCSYHPTLHVVNANLHRLFSPGRWSARSLTFGTAASEDTGGSVGSGAGLPTDKYKFVRIKGISDVSKFDADFGAGLQEWVARNDPLRKFIYYNRTSVATEGYRASCYEGAVDGERETYCFIQGVGSDAIFGIRHLLEHGAREFHVLAEDRVEAHRMLTEICEGYGREWEFDCTGFGGLCGKITLRITGVAGGGGAVTTLPRGGGSAQLMECSREDERVAARKRTGGGQGPGILRQPTGPSQGEPGEFKARTGLTRDDYRAIQSRLTGKKLEEGGDETQDLVCSVEGDEAGLVERAGVWGARVVGPGGCGAGEDELVRVSGRKNDCFWLVLKHVLSEKEDEGLVDRLTKMGGPGVLAVDAWRRDRRITLNTLSEILKLSNICCDLHGYRVESIGAPVFGNLGFFQLDVSNDGQHVEICRCQRPDYVHGLRKHARMVPFKRDVADNFHRLVTRSHYGKVLTLNEKRRYMEALRIKLERSDAVMNFPACIIFGSPGSGKSTGSINRFVKWINDGKPGANWQIVYPNSDVRDDVREKIRPLIRNRESIGSHLTTPELAHDSKCGGIWVVSELGRWVPGQLEMLVISKQPDFLIIDGDPAQGSFPVMDVSDVVLRGERAISYQLDYCAHYLFSSWRLPGNYQFFGYPCHGKIAAYPSIIAYPPLGSTILVPEIIESQRIRECAGYYAYTYGACQGWDTDKRVVLRLSRSSGLCSEGQLYTAMTRSKAGFDVHLHDLPENFTFRRGSIAEALRTCDIEQLSQAVNNHLASSLPKAFLNPLNTLVGAGPSPYRTQGKEDRRAHYDPLQVRLDDLKEWAPEYGYIDFLHDGGLPFDDVDLEDSGFEEEPLRSEWLQSAEAGGDANEVADAVFGPIPDKYSREEVMKFGTTDQVREEPLGQSIFLQHRAKDTTLMKWAIKKRVKFRKVPADVALTMKKAGAEALISTFERVVGAGLIPFDEPMFLDRKRRSLQNLLEKDKDLNKAKDYKCDPTTPDHWTYLLIKQQVIKKMGTINRKAKAGQILTEHHHGVALELAPVFMYILYKLQEVLTRKGRRTYFHAGKSDGDLAEFVAKHWDFSKMSTEDDAEAWDSSVNASCIGFEFYLFDKFCIPNGLKDKFVKYKCLMTCIRGAIDFMMFSGGPDTLPFNSILNFTLTNLRYDMPTNVVELYSGDDSAFNEVLKFSKWWLSHSEEYFEHTFKTRVCRHPHAFGWVIRPVVHKDPETVLARCVYAAASGKMLNCIDSLMADCTTLLSDVVNDALDEREQDYCMLAVGMMEHYRRYYHLKDEVGFTRGKLGGRRSFDLRGVAEHMGLKYTDDDHMDSGY